MKMKWDDSALRKEVHDKAVKKLTVAAETIRTNAIKSMGSGATGYKPYPKRKNKDKIHWSSVPPAPPHVDTGRLRASITWAISENVPQGNQAKGAASEEDVVQIPDSEHNRITAVVGTNVKYARALEFGFAPRNLKARPYLRPALEKAVAKIKWLFSNE